MHWYRFVKKSALFGTDPFGASELSDKTRESPYGFAGGDARTGVWEASDGNHHPNDCFGENYAGETIEKKLEELKKKKMKNRMKIKKRKKVTAQFGSGSVWPHIDNPPTGSGDWVTDTFKEIDKKDDVAPATEPPVEKTNNPKKDAIQLMGKTSYTVISSFEKTPAEIGTGFFFASDKIITCAHVVGGEETPTEVVIRIDEDEYSCNILAIDTAIDVAVLEVVNYESEIYLNLGDSANLELGDEILVYGSPLGFENVVQQGIIASNPTVYEGENNVNQNFIFITANIVAGNSGSPVLKIDDNTVVSMASASISQGEHSGDLYATTPINEIKEFLNKNNLLKTANTYALYKTAFISNKQENDFIKKAETYNLIKEAAGMHDPENVDDMHKTLKYLEKFLGLSEDISDLSLFINPLSVGSKRILLKPYKLVGMVKRLNSLAREYKREKNTSNHNVLREIRKDFHQTLKSIKDRLSK